MAKHRSFSKRLFDMHIHIQGCRNTICGQDFTRYQLVSCCHEHCFYIHIIYIWCVYMNMCVQICLCLWKLESEDGFRSFVAEVIGICGTLIMWALESELCSPWECRNHSQSLRHLSSPSVMIWIRNVSHSLVYCIGLHASRFWRIDSVLKSLT